MFVPDNYHKIEVSVKNSRFIAELYPVTGNTLQESQQTARTLIKQKKEQYADASHVCHAFILGDTAQILGCSDDGEPSGTAGRPMLTVLKGSALTNVIVTVTRYFGGTLLGTGGLVKAYSTAVKNVISETKLVPLVKTASFTIVAPYSTHSTVKHVLEVHHAQITGETFDSDVTITAYIAEDTYTAMSADITSQTNAHASCTRTVSG